jgi:EAL domain-containing protein (putative c-di-GMP-specific phosphodiesterase class I)
VAARLQQALEAPVEIDGHEIVTSVSIGIAASTAATESPDTLLRNADAAMYRAKSSGRARAEVFDADMHAQAVARLRLEAELRRALERDEFELHYQPIVCLATGRVAGFEALVRWLHPTRGLVSPGEFVPVAEDSGLILPIGAWVLAAACRQMGAWQAAFPAARDMTMSVNISARQFAQPDLLERVRGVLRETGLPATSLKLEITESAAMGNVTRTQEILEALRAIGIRFSIDDFGTGYSSLSYLRKFPLQTLKIDRSFIDGMEREQESREIVRGIIALARTLGMDVVAEGTETPGQVDHLRDLACEFGQGYFFQHPANAARITELIAGQDAAR